MKKFSQTIDIRLDIEGPQIPARFFSSRNSTSNAGALQGVQGDRVRVRLWLCSEASQIGQPHVLSEANGPVILAVKRGAVDEKFIAIADAFRLASTDTGDIFYEDVLNLNTVEMAALFIGDEEKFLATLDIELQSPGNAERMTFQRQITIYRQIYQGDEAPPTAAGTPWPAPGSIVTNEQLNEIIAENNAGRVESAAELAALGNDYLQRIAAAQVSINEAVGIIAAARAGALEWRNQTTGKFHLVTIQGEEGRPLFDFSPGYDLPAGDVRAAVTFRITPAITDRPVALGEIFTVTAADVFDAVWLTPGSLVSIGNKGRAKVESVAADTITLCAIAGDFEEPLSSGDLLSLVALAGARGITGTGTGGDTGGYGISPLGGVMSKNAVLDFLAGGAIRFSGDGRSALINEKQLFFEQGIYSSDFSAGNFRIVNSATGGVASFNGTSGEFRASFLREIDGTMTEVGTTVSPFGIRVQDLTTGATAFLIQPGKVTIDAPTLAALKAALGLPA